MTYLTSDWKLHNAVQNASSYYHKNISSNRQHFIVWMSSEYNIDVVLVPSWVFDGDALVYAWKVERINDEEKAILFKIEWS